MRIDGACHCGLITYEAEVDPEQVEICHCTDCQNLSGSAFRVVVAAAADKFLMSGERTVYVKTAERAEQGAFRLFAQDADRRFTRRAPIRNLHGIICGWEPFVSATNSPHELSTGPGPPSNGSMASPRYHEERSSNPLIRNEPWERIGDFYDFDSARKAAFALISSRV